MENENEQQKQFLDNFLVNNQELEELSARLARFNVFHVLKSERSELKHSNVLAWLFDPEQSHGLSDIPLRRVLSNIFLSSSLEESRFSAANIELMDLGSIEIRREWKNIDLLIIDRENDLVVVIENKIGARESLGQLKKYRNTIRKEEEFRGFENLFVYLTLMGEETNDPSSSYVSYSYAQIIPIIEMILEQKGNQISENVNVFITQYLDVLRRLTMQDEKITELCRAIYKKHRDAIDLINEYGAINVFQETIENFLEQRKEYRILSSRGSYVYFMAVDWLDVVPQNGTAQKSLDPRYSIYCFYHLNSKNTMRFVFELSAMDDPDLRLTYANALRDAGFNGLTDAAFSREAKFSRFHSESKKIKDVGDGEEMLSVAENLFNKSEEKFAQAREVLLQLGNNAEK